MIVAIAGRRIDSSNAEKPVFPLSLTDFVKAKLIDALRDANATHIISSGACGADLIAMQAAEKLGISRTMVLPFNAETFKTTSVTDRPGDWGPLYDKLVSELKQSGQLIELNFDKDNPDVYTKTNFRILDEAEKLAAKTPHYERESRTEMMALIVWEGKPRSTGDTTHHFMQEARKRNFMIKEILSNEQYV